MTMFDGLGKALASLRTERGLNQREVADRAHVAPGLMSQYESERVSPSLSTLGRVLEALGATPRDLIDKLDVIQKLEAGGREVSIPRVTRTRRFESAPGAYLMVPVELGELFAEEARRELLRTAVKDTVQAMVRDEDEAASRREAAHREAGFAAEGSRKKAYKKA